MEAYIESVGVRMRLCLFHQLVCLFLRELETKSGCTLGMALVVQWEVLA